MNDGLINLCLLLAGSIFFPLHYLATKYILIKYFRHRFSLGDIYLICEKCTCSTQAVLSFVAGVVIVSQVNDIMKDTHWLTNSYAWFGLPYFVHDVWAMYMTFVYNGAYKSESLPPRDQALKLYVRSTPLLIAHHIIMPAFIFPTIIFLRNNLGDFFVGTFYMIEVTIPFISARAVFAQLNMQNTALYIITGLLMVISFFCVRVLVFPYLYWRYAIHSGISILDVPRRIPIKCNLGCLMILLPQLYWFGLMLRGTVKVFYKIFTRQKSKPNGTAVNGCGKVE